MSTQEFNMNWLIANLGMNIATFAIFTVFLCALFERKFSIWITYGTSIIGLGIILAQIDKLMPKYIAQFFAIASMVAFTILFYKGTAKSKLIGFLLGYTAINLSSVPAYYIACMLGIADSTVLALVYVALFLILCGSLMFMICRTWKSISLASENKGFISFFLLPISQLFMTLLVITFFSKNPVDGYDNALELQTNRTAMLLFSLALALSFIGDGLFINAFSKMATSMRERQRLQVLETENKMTYEYVKDMESDVLTIRRYRHDFLNLLGTVRNSVKKKDDSSIDDAIGIIDQMTRDVQAATGKQYCACNIINCILAHEERSLAKRNVSCDFRIEIPEQLGVDELDLCRLLSNLIDNAGDACQQFEDEEKRKVYVSMRIIDGYLFTAVRNAKTSGELNLESSKQNSDEHGLGLDIVRDIVKRSNGTLDFTDEDTSVTVTASMEWNDNR